MRGDVAAPAGGWAVGDPHSPHPPPASLSPPPRRVSQIMSAVHTLGGSDAAVTKLHERLEAYESRAALHHSAMHDITSLIDASRAKAAAYASAVQKNTARPGQHPAPQPPHAYDVEHARGPIVCDLRGQPPDRAVDIGQQRIAALKARLASLRAGVAAESETWLEKERTYQADVAALKEEIVQQVLVEREIGILREKTASYLPLKFVKKLDQRVSSTFEKSLMEAHDDVGMAHLPIHDVGRQTKAAPRGRVAVAMINTLNIEDIWEDNERGGRKVVAEGHRLFRNLLKAALAESSGYESICQGFNSLVVFPSINDCVPWCLAFLQNLERHYPRLLQTRIGVDVGTVKAQLNFVTTRYNYYGAVVGGAAHVCQFAQPFDLILTKEALQGIDIDVLYSLREVRSLKGSEAKNELVPPSRCMILAHREQVQNGRRRNSDSDDESTVASGERRRKSKKKKFQPLGCWWVNTGARKDRPWELPLEPKRRQQKPRIVPHILEFTEYELMRNNDSILRKPAPTGTVTLVFTDVQSSTALWDKQPVAMKKALNVHNKVMRANIERFCGYEVRTEGDAFMVAFSEARLALGWCMNVQRELLLIDWPQDILGEEPACVEHEYDTETQSYKTLYNGLRVRMGFNTCEPTCQVSNISNRMGYFGPSVHLCAAVSNVGRGGETVIGYNSYKAITRHGNIDDVAIIPLGPSKLSGISKPETIFSVYPLELARRPALAKKRDEEKESKAKLMLEHAAARKSSRAILSVQQMEELVRLDRFLPRLAKRMRSLSGVLSCMETQQMQATQGCEAPHHNGKVYLVYQDIPQIYKLYEVSPDVCRSTILKHNTVTRAMCERYRGKELRSDNCAHMIAFSSVVDALNFCLAVQRALMAVPDWDPLLRTLPDFEPVYSKGGRVLFWGPRVAMGFNRCPVVPTADPWQLECVPETMKRAAKVSSFARGGEIAAGFDAFAELTVLEEERGGGVFYQCHVHEKGEHAIMKDHSEYIHVIVPNGYVGRIEYWNATMASTRRVPNFWVSDPKAERYDVVFKYLTPPEMTNSTLPMMLQQMAKIIIALREWAQEDAARKPSENVLSGVPQRHTAKAIAFVANLYQRLMMERKKEFTMTRFPRPIQMREQEQVLVQLEDMFMNFATEADLMMRKNRAPGQSYLAKIQKDVKKETLDGHFNPIVAKQLMLEFHAIDDDMSGTIHMNEVVRANFQFSYLSGPFDEKLFKRMDRDRDGVISYFEMLRFFFPKTKPVLLQRWLDHELAQAKREQYTAPRRETLRLVR